MAISNIFGIIPDAQFNLSLYEYYNNYIPLVLWLIGIAPSANSSSSEFESLGQHSLRRSLQKTLSLNSLLNFSCKKHLYVLMFYIFLEY